MGLTNISHLGILRILFVVKGEGRGDVRNIVLKLEKHPTKVCTQSLFLTHTHKWCNLLTRYSHTASLGLLLFRESKRAKLVCQFSQPPPKHGETKERKIKHDCWTHIRVYYHILLFPKSWIKRQHCSNSPINSGHLFFNMVVVLLSNSSSTK
jgi:hypothetical protein